jgi:AAA15 family ATPase/GTPase
MNRIFGMVLALVNASNGMLLVDEVENGIHYSVQEEMWTLIMKIAERLNVQVFATSHSWDCVTAFERAAVRNRRVEGKLLRLERLGETVAATPFNERELEIAAEAGIEVR